MVGFIAVDCYAVEPTDIALWPKWVLYAGVAAVFSIDYYVAKRYAEIARLEKREGGPQGILYTLRAKESGYFPTVRGGSVYLQKGDVWKYGETTQNPAEERYEKKWLRQMNLEFHREKSGNQREMKIAEKYAIYGYFFEHRELPPGNRIFR